MPKIVIVRATKVDELDDEEDDEGVGGSGVS